MREQKLTAVTGLRRKSYIPTFGNLPLRGYLDGFITSLDSDTEHDVSVAAGVARDTDNTGFIVSSSAIVKQIDATWAAGSAAGGLNATDFGTSGPAVDTWYHFFVIGKEDGSVDAGWDTMTDASQLLSDAGSDFTMYRRVASHLTDGSSNLVSYTQSADEFLWGSPPTDVNSTNPGTAAQTATLTVPTGIVVRAFVMARLSTPNTTSASIYLSALDQTDVPVTGATGQVVAASSATGTHADLSESLIRTNTSSQIRWRLSASTTTTDVDMATRGWLDPRGRNA